MFNKGTNKFIQDIDYNYNIGQSLSIMYRTRRQSLYYIIQSGKSSLCCTEHGGDPRQAWPRRGGSRFM